MLQACHAATAALWESRGEAATGAYCAPNNLDHMHKVGRNIGCVNAVAYIGQQMATLPTLH